MHIRPWIPAALLLLLLALTAGGWVWTREPASATQAQADSPAPRRGLRRATPGRERLVDQSTLLTARSLVPLATTLEEEQLALQAERLANHEVDLAFTDALRRAASEQAPQTPELKELAELKAKAQAEVEADRQVIARLHRQLAAARESLKGPLEDQLEVAKAQLQLDQDELEAISEDFSLAGGDPQARIQRLKEAHEAADRESSQAMVAAKAVRQARRSSLLAWLSEWRFQRGKNGRLEQARQAALAKVDSLTRRRATILERANQEKEDREAAEYWASNLVKESAAKDGGPGRDQALDAVSYLRQYGDVQQRLSDLGRRIQDQQELAGVYGSWMGLVEGYRSLALHGLLGRLLWALGLILAAYLAGLLVDQLFHWVSSGEKQGASTLRAVVKMVVQVLCVLAIGFVIFGIPAQATTVFGLAGAGLTVALKDFIVAFFGWFILMGRNGIRVGDWVEIRGVGGEVVEIGLLRTVVLESGSWADMGHPTGRRVAFVNNFAIEGHFFNFSTAGRWMWDELRVLIPMGQDPYPIIDGIQKLVEKQTEDHARAAEQEWQRATARYRVRAFSVTPGLNVVPSLNGIEVRARYLTQASERHPTRLRLNQAVVHLMHGPRGEISAGSGT